MEMKPFIEALVLAMPDTALNDTLRAMNNIKIGPDLRANAYNMLWLAILQDESKRREYKD